MHALAIAMLTHARLGSTDETARAAGTVGCVYDSMPAEVVRRLVETCGTVKNCVSWPEGRVGELEGVVG